MIISVEDVRIKSGAPSSLVSDSEIESIISEVEGAAKKYLNAVFTPEETVEVNKASGWRYFYVDNIPLLSVRDLRSDGLVLDVSEVLFDSSGKVELTSDNDPSVLSSKTQGVSVRYVHGWVVEGAKTKSTSEVSAGISVSVSVSDTSIFEVGDWIRLKGLDGHVEACKVESVGSGVLTVDELAFSHESGSIVVKLLTPEFIKQYLKVEATIYVALNAIGATYTFNASYSLGDLNIQKGVPYTHWSESIQKAFKEREALKKRVKPRFKII